MSTVSLDSILDSKKAAAKAEAEDHDGPSIQYADQVLAEAGKSALGIFTLPLGYIDNQGELHTEFTVREMTGEEEDILSNDKVSMQMRMNKLLENCITAVGPYKQGSLGWSDLCLALTRVDRLYAMLQIRILTLGPVFAAKVKCSNEECGKYANQNVDLNDFKVKEIADPMVRTYTGKLPKSGLTFKAKIWTGLDETRMEKAAQKMPGSIISVIMATRMLSLGEDKAPISVSKMAGLPLVDRTYLRKEIERYEGDIDRSLECECPHCGHDFKENVEIFTGNFFFPSET